MIAKNLEIAAALILLSILISLPGCSKSSEPDTAKSVNANQPATIVNNTIAPVNTTPAANNTPLSNANADKKPAPSAAKTPPPQIGSGGSDFALFQSARSMLNSDGELTNAVIIEIKEGNAVLTGSVSSEAQKAKAGKLVQSVNGIKGVKNNLTVAR